MIPGNARTHSTFSRRSPAAQPRQTVYTNRYNTIVIGMGGMGSAVAYQLAKRGKRVLGLEKFDVPHDMGSSHGYTRIIRLAYYEHPSYVMLLKRAYELWEEIEARAGEKLLHITGSIDAGPADSWVFKGSHQSCIEHDLPHEVLTGTELAERFPGYGLPHETLALYQPRGGFLAPERCIVGHCFAALAHGAEIHGREPVLGWEPLGDEGVRVYTTRAVYEADSLVITAGAWNDQMLGFLRGLAVPERQVLAWFQPERPELYRTDNFPVFNMLVDEGRFYGFPVHGVPGFKIGKYHHLQESGPADTVNRDVTPADEQVLRDCTSRYFPRAAGPTMTLKTCMFTNAPDGHFLIDLHPHAPQVSYASACSGHGFKFASVIGEILADLALYRETRHNIELFRHARFTHSTRPAGAHTNRQASGHGHSSHSHSGASRRGEHAAAHGSDTHFAGDDADAIRSPWL
ncbi:MAG: N-methyl-L-tryptophan oxidase [Litorilinea sp.]